MAKIRDGFVSNSSSSSFICDVCSEEYQGYDGTYEIDTAECVNGHYFCAEHLLECLDEDNIYDDDNLYKECTCPICMFKVISNYDIAKYLYNIYKIDKQIVFDEIKKVNKRRKRLYDYEYVKYIFDKFELTEDIILKKIKDEFGVYSNFLNNI